MRRCRELTRVAGEAVKGGPTTPSEQAAALAGVAEKKIGAYKTFKGTCARIRPVPS